MGYTKLGVGALDRRTRYELPNVAAYASVRPLRRQSGTLARLPPAPTALSYDGAVEPGELVDAEALVRLQETSYQRAAPGLRSAWPAESAMDAAQLVRFLNEHHYCVLATVTSSLKPRVSSCSPHGRPGMARRPNGRRHGSRSNRRGSSRTAPQADHLSNTERPDSQDAEPLRTN